MSQIREQIIDIILMVLFYEITRQPLGERREGR